MVLNPKDGFQKNMVLNPKDGKVLGFCG